MADDIKSLKTRIAELENEVLQREQDLSRFRNDLAQANQQLQGLIAQVSGELKVAQTIYRNLVPTEFPHISGFEFSTKFSPSMVSGGDYYDIFEHEDRMRFGLVLSSASGHALSALLLSVLIKMAGQMEGRQSPQPKAIVDKIETELKEHLSDRTELDLFYGMVDRRTYSMEFIRIGQVLAFHISDGGEIQMIGDSIPPMTQGFKNSAPSQKISLNPRDRIVLVSRGAALMENLKGESFGWERVSQALRSTPKGGGIHDLRQNLSLSLQKFTGGAEIQRDVTIVALEVKDKVIRLAPPK